MARASPARPWRACQIISLARAWPLAWGRRRAGREPWNGTGANSGTARRADSEAGRWPQGAFIGRRARRMSPTALANPSVAVKAATPLPALHELVSGGIGIDRGVGHRSRRLLEPLALAEPAGPGEEPLDHDGAQLLAD